MKQEIIDQLQVGLELKKSGVVLKWGDSKEEIEAKSPSSIDYLAAQKLTRYIWDQEIVFGPLPLKVIAISESVGDILRSLRKIHLLPEMQVNKDLVYAQFSDICRSLYKIFGSPHEKDDCSFRWKLGKVKVSCDVEKHSDAPSGIYIGISLTHRGIIDVEQNNQPQN